MSFFLQNRHLKIPALIKDQHHISDHRNAYHQRSMSSHLSHRDGVIEPRLPSHMPESSRFPKPTYYSPMGPPQFSNVTPAHSHNNLSSQNSAPNPYFRSSSSLHPHLEYWNGNPNESFDGSIAASMTSTTSLHQPLSIASTSHLPTPTSTPTTQRKNRRISHLFVSYA